MSSQSELKRESTRIVRAIPITVRARDSLNQSFEERTETLSISCHGCQYASKHSVAKNATVDLIVGSPGALALARSRVIWIWRPRSVREMFRIAVKLEDPGNVWGIEHPPNDWFSGPYLGPKAAGSGEVAPRGPAGYPNGGTISAMLSATSNASSLVGRSRKGPGVKARPRARNQVFVVHGRNEKVRKALFAFLRSVGVQPIEWNKALELTKKGSPYVGEVIDAAFRKANVVVVLFTPDDEARLKAEFVGKDDPGFERKLTGQPRPNVLFEAGMAFGRQPDSTILVHVGKIRTVSDVAGRHIVRLTNSIGSRQQLLSKLRAAGLALDDIGDDWHTEGDFTLG